VAQSLPSTADCTDFFFFVASIQNPSTETSQLVCGSSLTTTALTPSQLKAALYEVVHVAQGHGIDLSEEAAEQAHRRLADNAARSLSITSSMQRDILQGHPSEVRSLRLAQFRRAHFFFFLLFCISCCGKAGLLCGGAKLLACPHLFTVSFWPRYCLKRKRRAKRLTMPIFPATCE
jgi:hypothetical protein